MTISVVCPQGHKLNAKEKLAGKRIKCPKCGSVVKIPEVAVPEPHELDPLADGGLPPLEELDPLASGAASDAAADDSLGLGDEFGQSDSLTGDGLPPLDDSLGMQAELPAAPAAQKTPLQASTDTATEEQKLRSNLPLITILGIVGGGAVVGFLFVGVLAWFLFGGSDEKPPVVAVNNGPPVDSSPTEPTEPAPKPNELPQSEPDEPEVQPAEPEAPSAEPEARPAEPEAPPAEPEPTTPVREPEPFDLTRVRLNKQLDGFKLPGVTWAAAYDEVTGRLAITNDERGILVYDLDELLAGNPAPVATLPTDGLPTAVCLKPLPDRRAFVIAGQDEAKLLLVDAETLQPFGKIMLEGLKFVDFLTGSPNPNDPLVYYSTQQYQRMSPSGSEKEDNETAERLGRVNLLTGAQDGPTEEHFCDVTVSADGGWLYARSPTTADGVSCTWSELLTFKQGSRDSKVTQWPRNYAASPVCPLGAVVAVNSMVYTPSMTFHIARLDYSPAAAFQRQPVLFGLSNNAFVFGSANDYRRLASIPLPSDWLRTDRGNDPSDFRSRPDLSPSVRTGFLDIRADSTRGLAVSTFGEHLVIASLEKAKLRSEPSLFVDTTLPDKVAPGELLEVDLTLRTDTEDVVFEYVPNTDWLADDGGNDLTTPTTAAPPPGKSLNLAAAVNNQQNLILIHDLKPLSGETLPLDIQIGDEKMVVTSVDDFKSALTVQRTEPASHSVTSKVLVLAEAESLAEADLNLPIVEGRTFRWTPNTDQLGKHTIRMRAKAGGISHEWFWDIKVERSGGDLPFQVVGIEPAPGTGYAVIWGQATLPQPSSMRSSQTPEEPNSYFVGIYHLAKQQLIRHVEVPKPIVAAALHETGVYAIVKPAQIVRLDVRTLEVADQVAIEIDCSKLQLIAGRYLVASGRGRSGAVRFNIPDLTPVEPRVLGYRYALEGRVRDGWVWDGVLWDDALKQPRLLLFPVHFERSSGGQDESQMIAAQGGTILMQPQGCYTCTWRPDNVALGGQYRLTNFPAALSCTGGMLQAYSWAAPSRPRVGREPTPMASVKLLDLNSIAIPGDRRTLAARAAGYVTEEDGQVHVAMLGKLYSVPLERLVQEEESFRFVEQQDRFVLEAGKTARLTYSAPGAVKYHLQLWRQRPRFHDEEPKLTAESTDGKFELALDEMDDYVSSALGAAKVGRTERNSGTTMDRVEEYLQEIEPAYRRLTGKKSRGVPFPIYISVIAEHEDGQQKAGLAHSYLIEVPLRNIQAFANRR
jgi:hypothetical protein